MKNLKKKLSIVCLCACLSVFSSGCVYLVVGTIGALGGYMVSPDTVEGITENEKEYLWDSAINVLTIMGMIEEQQESSGIIIAKVNGAKVTVTITPLNQTTVKINVKARKAFLPQSQLAQDVFVKIMSQVNE